MNNDMKESEDKNSGSVKRSTGQEKRHYTPPAVISAEPLEAVAVVCAPSVPGGPGKTIQPFGCATLGS
jgi:hypothetical protein